MVTTIQIDEDIKKKLDLLKIHHRETYNELIERLINKCVTHEPDYESLIETLEILSDPELMKGIKNALIRIENNNYGTSIEEVKKEFHIK